MKDKLLNIVAFVVGSIVILSILTTPVALIIAIWTKNQIALNIGATCFILWACYVFATDRK